MENRRPCVNEEESRYPSFAPIGSSRRLCHFDAGLNDITSALRIFPQHPGRFPHFPWRLLETMCHSKLDLPITVSFYRLRKSAQQGYVPGFHQAVFSVAAHIRLPRRCNKVDSCSSPRAQLKCHLIRVVFPAYLAKAAPPPPLNVPVSL